MGVSPTQSEAIVQILELVGNAGAIAWANLPPEKQRQLERAIAPDVNVIGQVMPASQEELATVMTYAQQQGWGVVPAGKGSKLNWGGVIELGDRATSQPMIVVGTERMNRLVEHAVGDLTVTVEAGMGFAELQAILAKEGQFLAIDPAYPEQATLGGIVATADTGSLRQRYNSVRDMLLGISFVRADGQLVKAGGRVVKNVAGYDLMKLFTGSFGTLGVISQVTFRVYPLPEASRTIVLTGEATAIAQLAQALLQSALTPVSLDILSDSLVRSLNVGTGTGLAVRFQTIAQSVQDQIAKTADLGRSLGLTHSLFGNEDDPHLWNQLREQMTVATDPDTITCKIGIRPADAIALFSKLDSFAFTSWSGQIHAASGLGRLMIRDANLQPELMSKIRAQCVASAGFLSVLSAPVAFKKSFDAWGTVGNALDTMRQIKQRFDPEYRLSPHRFVGGI